MADPLELLRAALEGRYAVERPIGQGGMATVYLAMDVRHGRPVAVKVLRSDLAASIGADRFLREIKVAATLQHPNILGLFDSGEASGLLYYVMPFVEGESLRDRLNREQQLPLHDALQIVREAAEALAYAHERGIVHRDIKPENILLQQGHALVADFGIARAVSEAGGEKLTQTGMAVGTPHYMSPEQSLGSEHVDARSDVYSLGCVLYELLIGQPPFDGPNAMAILARHSMEVVPSLQVVRQSIPDEVEDAVMQALEKTPADRFQTMVQFAEVLEGAEAETALQRTAARRAATVRRASGASAARRRTSGAVPAAKASLPARGIAFARGQGARFWVPAAALLLVAGGFSAWRAWLRPGNASGTTAGFIPNHIAVMYFASRGGSDSLGHVADGLTEALIHELSEVSALQVISQNGVLPYKTSTVAPDSVARALKVGTLVEGTLTQAGDRLRVSVSLVNAVTGAEIGSKTLERPREQVFALQDDLAKEVAIFLRERLGQEIRVRESQTGTRNAAAWELLQKAEHLVKDVDPLLATADTAGASRRLAGADTLLARAAEMDPKWATPLVKRGWLAYRQFDLIGTFDKAYYLKWIQRGMAQADRALQLKPDAPDALELRGTLRYYKWILNLEPDQTAAAQLLAGAEKDLRGAVAGDPTAAFAWSLLSHLLMGQSETGEAKLAAMKAYEADPYLTAAKQTVWRLFNASLDLEDAVEAHHWCEEGQRRFPEYNRFVECQIWLYALKGETPDIPKAWQLLEQYVQITPPPQREFQRRYGQMIVAMALARAGLKDSADAVAKRARADAATDPTRDLALLETYVRILLQDPAQAIRLLSTYIATNPQFRASLARDQSWWFQSLRDDPRFKALSGTGS